MIEDILPFFAQLCFFEWILFGAIIGGVIFSIPAIICEIHKWAIVIFIFEEKYEKPNPVLDWYFRKIIKCTDYNDAGRWKHGKKVISWETYYDWPEYYFHAAIYGATLSIIIQGGILFPLAYTVIGIIIAVLFGSRAIVRLGKKVKAISSALDEHKSDPNAHKEG